MLPDQKEKINNLKFTWWREAAVNWLSEHNMRNCHGSICGTMYYFLYIPVVLSGECDLKMQNVMFFVKEHLWDAVCRACVIYFFRLTYVKLYLQLSVKSIIFTMQDYNEKVTTQKLPLKLNL